MGDTFNWNDYPAAGTPTPPPATPASQGSGFDWNSYPTVGQGTAASGMPADVAARHARSMPQGANYGQPNDPGVISGTATGFAKGAGETLQGIARLAGGKSLVDAGMLGDTDTSANSWPEKFGKGVEDIGEFGVGDEALKGLANATKMVRLANKYPIIARTLNMAKEHPVLEKMISEGAKAAMVGGVEGGVKGAAKGEALSGAATGAATAGVGGAAVSGLAETLPKLPQTISDIIASRSEKLNGKALKDATNLLKNAVAPGGLKATELRPFDEMMGALDRHIPQYTSVTPLEKDEGLLESGDMILRARQNLWDNVVEPIIDNHANYVDRVQDVAKAAKNASKDATTDEESKAILKYADRFEQEPVMSVREMHDEITSLNGNKAVRNFLQADPEKQAAMLGADPALRGKVVALKLLKQKVFDKIADVSGEGEATKLVQARRDWGLLSDAYDWISTKKGPNPESFGGRVINTIKGLFALKRMSPEALTGSAETIFNRNNPNKLVTKALNTLRSGGAPEAVERTAPGTASDLIGKTNPATALAKIPGNVPVTEIPSTEPVPGGVAGEIGGEKRGLTEIGGAPGKGTTQTATEGIKTAPPKVETPKNQLPAAKAENVAPAKSGTHRTAGVVRVGPETKVAAPEATAYTSPQARAVLDRQTQLNNMIDDYHFAETPAEKAKLEKQIFSTMVDWKKDLRDGKIDAGAAKRTQKKIAEYANEIRATKKTK